MSEEVEDAHPGGERSVRLNSDYENYSLEEEEKWVEHRRLSFVEDFIVQVAVL